MTKAVLIIAIVFMTGALFTQSIYAYKLNAVQTLVAEEEPHEEKPSDKSKEDKKDKYFSVCQFAAATDLTLAGQAYLSHCFIFSKGFVDKPFTPPDQA